MPFRTSLEMPHSLHISVSLQFAPTSGVWSKLHFALLGWRKPVLGLRGFQRARGVAMAEEGGRAGGGRSREVATSTDISLAGAALRMKTDVVGAKACQRARHIRRYRTALRLGRSRAKRCGTGPGGNARQRGNTSFG